MTIMTVMLMIIDSIKVTYADVNEVNTGTEHALLLPFPYSYYLLPSRCVCIACCPSYFSCICGQVMLCYYDKVISQEHSHMGCCYCYLTSVCKSNDCCFSIHVIRCPVELSSVFSKEKMLKTNTRQPK